MNPVARCADSPAGHADFELVAQHRKNIGDAIVAAHREAVQRRAAKQHALRTQRNGFGDIAAATHAAIDQDMRMRRRVSRDFRKDFERAAQPTPVHIVQST